MTMQCGSPNVRCVLPKIIMFAVYWAPNQSILIQVGDTRSQQECNVTFSQLRASEVSLRWNVGRSPIESNIFVQDK